MTGSNQTSFRNAFPNASSYTGTTALGCAATCDGYELLADLDFDTNTTGKGYADSGDSYWNSGRGWLPIGDSATAYTGDFDGNNATSTGAWGIYNLFVDLVETSTIKPNAGLFGVTENATIRNVSLYNVSVHARTGSGHTGPAAAGALIGHQKGGVTSYSYAEGHVGAGRGAGGTTQQNNAMAGGLVGNLDDSSTAGGVVRLSAADVGRNGPVKCPNPSRHPRLLRRPRGSGRGRNRPHGRHRGFLRHRRRRATADPSSNVIGHAESGGLVGWVEDGDIVSSYSTATPTASIVRGTARLRALPVT